MEERPQKETTIETRTGLGSLLGRLYRPGPLVFLFMVAFAGLLYLGYSLLTTPITSTTPVAVNATTPKDSPPQEQPVSRVYEEESFDLEDKVKQADLAIIEALQTLQINIHELKLLGVEIKTIQGKGYHYQVLRLPLETDFNHFRQELLARLAHRVPEATTAVEGAKELDISIENTPTHRLLIETPKPAPAKPAVKGPSLVIVIDDIGENMKILKGLVNLDVPLTCAVWPSATHTRPAVDLILKKHRDLLIHFPMEPKGYPRYKPGKHALFVSMSNEEIKKEIQFNLSQIPEAIGVNNHMGSRFTGYKPGMTTALTEFGKHGLFFLDSLTTGKSVGRSVAQSVAIPFYERDVFLDNVKDVNTIIHQLKKAENVALKQGYAIAIGHPYKETLAALEKWTKRRNRSINVIPISQLPPQ